MSNELEPISILTIKKSIKDTAEKSVRPNIKPGTYPINKVFAFEGTLSVAEDTEVRPTSMLWSKETMVLILQRSGLQRDAMLQILQEVATNVVERIKNGGEGSVGTELANLTKDVENISNKFEKMLESLPKVPRKGAVSFNGDVREIQRVDGK